MTGEELARLIQSADDPAACVRELVDAVHSPPMMLERGWDLVGWHHVTTAGAVLLYRTEAPADERPGDADLRARHLVAEALGREIQRLERDDWWGSAAERDRLHREINELRHELVAAGWVPASRSAHRQAQPLATGRPALVLDSVLIVNAGEEARATYQAIVDEAPYPSRLVLLR